MRITNATFDRLMQHVDSSSGPTKHHTRQFVELRSRFKNAYRMGLEQGIDHGTLEELVTQFTRLEVRWERLRQRN